MPEGSHDASSNSVSSFEVVTDIEHDLGAPCVLHLSKERFQLGMDDGCIRPLAAISGKLQVDGRASATGSGDATARKLRACTSPGVHSEKK